MRRKQYRLPNIGLVYISYFLKHFFKFIMYFHGKGILFIFFYALYSRKIFSCKCNSFNNAKYTECLRYKSIRIRRIYYTIQTVTLYVYYMKKIINFRYFMIGYILILRSIRSVILLNLYIRRLLITNLRSQMFKVQECFNFYGNHYLGSFFRSLIAIILDSF